MAFNPQAFNNQAFNVRRILLNLMVALRDRALLILQTTDRAAAQMRAEDTPIINIQGIDKEVE